MTTRLILQFSKYLYDDPDAQFAVFILTENKYESGYPLLCDVKGNAIRKNDNIIRPYYEYELAINKEIPIRVVAMGLEIAQYAFKDTIIYPNKNNHVYVKVKRERIYSNG